MRVTSRGDLSLESMPDAPDAEWLRALLTDYNDLKRQVVATSKANTIEDNTPYREKSVNLVHGVEEEVASPLDSGLRVTSVSVMQVEGLVLDSLGKASTAVYALGLDKPLAWRHSPNEGKVYVTAKFDITPSTGVTARVNLLFVGG